MSCFTPNTCDTRYVSFFSTPASSPTRWTPVGSPTNHFSLQEFVQTHRCQGSIPQSPTRSSSRTLVSTLRLSPLYFWLRSYTLGLSANQPHPRCDESPEGFRDLRKILWLAYGKGSPQEQPRGLGGQGMGEGCWAPPLLWAHQSPSTLCSPIWKLPEPWRSGFYGGSTTWLWLSKSLAIGD